MSIGLQSEPESKPTAPAGPDSHALRDTDSLPVTIIEPRSGWRIIDVNEIWRARELLAFLIWRDIKIRYKQTAIGAAWALLQPLAMMAVLTFALGRVAGQANGPVPYWLFVLTGLLPWLLFSSALTQSATSVVNNQQLVTKVYFPRLLLPLSAVGLAVVDFFVGCLVLVVALPVEGVWPTTSIWLAPVGLLVLLAVSLGLGLGLAALTVRYRDFRVILPLAIQLGMFLTPGIYLQSAAFGPLGETLLLLNPVQGAVVNIRAALLGLTPDWLALGVAALEGAIVLVIGAAYFRRVERGFADVI